ncbi:hypothetical protein G7Z17_g9789 [Cylindrodendrum hubeiense]|uniref:Uncharacterized protein n=1 Tax=Cylindrodendrum hubeiense TaxID=595255 RepID=A0A9P5H0T5_9HYPO|nr:hypothetical protein G7Z17_g9789 [Cylindrodendrum hubeiense]
MPDYGQPTPTAGFPNASFLSPAAGPIAILALGSEQIPWHPESLALKPSHHTLAITLTNPWISPLGASRDAAEGAGAAASHLGQCSQELWNGDTPLGQGHAATSGTPPFWAPLPKALRQSAV